jgi:hypothetical protein
MLADFRPPSLRRIEMAPPSNVTFSWAPRSEGRRRDRQSRPTRAGHLALLFGIARRLRRPDLFDAEDERQPSRSYPSCWASPRLVSPTLRPESGLAGAPLGLVLGIVLAVSTLLVLVLFGVHVLTGGLYAMRTVIAMLFRSVVWCGIAVVGYRRLTSAPTA